MILGIETSCDETAVALVTADGRIRANVVASQAELHARYGGVVPEVASRRHLELVGPVLAEALDWDTITARLADTAPEWPIGSTHGYHALTYGWLAGELVRRVDP